MKTEKEIREELDKLYEEWLKAKRAGNKLSVIKANVGVGWLKWVLEENEN